MKPRRPASVLALLALVAGCGSGDTEAACGPVERAPEPAAFHIIGTVDFDYRYSPPAAGPHGAGTAPEAGIYEEPVPESAQVAAAEVGMVLVQYDSSLPPDGRRALEELGRGADDVIVAPVGRPIDGDRRVALTAWEQRQLCDEVDAAIVRGFIRQFAGRGPGEL